VLVCNPCNGLHSLAGACLERATIFKQSADKCWGAHASPRAISGVSPEALFGETPNGTRETRMLPFPLHPPAISGLKKLAEVFTIEEKLVDLYKRSLDRGGAAGGDFQARRGGYGELRRRFKVEICTRGDLRVLSRFQVEVRRALDRYSA
jgi:hypothetical protein